MKSAAFASSIIEKKIVTTHITLHSFWYFNNTPGQTLQCYSYILYLLNFFLYLFNYSLNVTECSMLRVGHLPGNRQDIFTSGTLNCLNVSVTTLIGQLYTKRTVFNTPTCESPRGILSLSIRLLLNRRVLYIYACTVAASTFFSRTGQLRVIY